MEPIIRQAEPADRAIIERIAEGVVRVLTIQDEIAGLVVLLPKADYLLLDNVAVAWSDRGRAWGVA